MKKFVISSDKKEGIEYFRVNFPKVSGTKLNVSEFDEPQIRFLMRDIRFTEVKKDTEKNARTSYKEVYENIFGHH